MSLEDISENGVFAVLAIDHRDSMRNFLAPDDPSSLSAQEITELKTDIVSGAAAQAGATGLMLESEYSIPQLIDNGSVPEGVGFLAALEAQGYFGALGTEPTTFLENWSPKQAAESGAAGCKLLLPYHPDRDLADAQAEVAAEALTNCRAAGMPLILEPLFYDLDDPADRERVVLATAERFAAMEPDLLKLPFPVDSNVESDRSVWASACAKITERVTMPWTVLSGGVNFDLFAEQVEHVVGAGGSGFMVGRALWGEAARLPHDERVEVVQNVVVPRFRKLRSLAGLQ